MKGIVFILIIVILGFLLWFLTIFFPVVGTIQILVVSTTIMVTKFFRYMIGACGLLLAALGMILLMGSYGRNYLKFFLACGLLVGVPISLIAFREFWIRSAEMIEIGEASVFTFLYHAFTLGYFYGLFAGIIGVIVYRFSRRKNEIFTLNFKV